jgi:hypothetical protein
MLGEISFYLSKITTFHSQRKGKETSIMTTNSVQAAIQDRIDPVLEAMIKGLIEATSRPKSSSRAADPVTMALSEALVADLMKSSTLPPLLARTISQVSPFEVALLAPALAEALTEALAPALAEALAPAIVTVLSNMASAETEKTSQESTSNEGSDKQGENEQPQGS